MFVEGNHVFGILKQNLAVDQRVVIGRTGDNNLDGMAGGIGVVSSYRTHLYMGVL